MNCIPLRVTFPFVVMRWSCIASRLIRETLPSVIPSMEAISSCFTPLDSIQMASAFVLRQKHQPESRMREIRTSGSEGGAAQPNALSIPLYKTIVMSHSLRVNCNKLGAGTIL